MKLLSDVGIINCSKIYAVVGMHKTTLTCTDREI